MSDNPTHEWLPIPFAGLYANADTIQARLMLLMLAKEYHIDQQNFDEAVKYREAEKLLEAKAEQVMKSLGATILTDTKLNPK